jgi:hypothetical protein
MTEKHESSGLSFSSADSLGARDELFRRLMDYPGSPEEIERSLGLFIRGSLLARFLAIAEIYKMIVHLPGIIVDVGTWRGQTAVLCENFRAIYETLHFNRRIVCFDTFDGYKGFSERDKPTKLHKEGTYAVGGSSYAKYLDELLVLHERSNAMGHYHGKHRVIEGDCRSTIPAFFDEFKNEIVSLAFLDLNAFEPTLDAFGHIYRRLVAGGVIAFWQLTRNSVPAEGTVYTQEIMQHYPHSISRSSYYPGLCYLTK